MYILVCSSIFIYLIGIIVFRFYIKFDFYNYAISPRCGHSVKKIKLRNEKISQNCDNFNMSSFICIEDPFVLEHNVGYMFRAKNIYHLTNLMRSMVYKLNNNNCIKVLVDPANFTTIKRDLNWIYLPFNLFFYEIKLMNSYSNEFYTQAKANSINLIQFKSNQIADVRNSIATMFKFYNMTIQHLLIHYLGFPFDFSGHVLELSSKGLTCFVDFAYLNYIVSKLHLRTNYKYNTLFQNARKLNSDSTKRFILLKSFRKDLYLHSNKGVFASGNIEPWFKLEMVHNPPINHSNIAQACQQALKHANNLPLPYFLFQILPPQDSKIYLLANRFGELVQEVLQQFNFALDRSKPVATFNTQMEEFFSD